MLEGASGCSLVGAETANNFLMIESRFRILERLFVNKYLFLFLSNSGHSTDDVNFQYKTKLDKNFASFNQHHEIISLRHYLLFANSLPFICSGSYMAMQHHRIMPGNIPIFGAKIQILDIEVSG